MNKILVFLLKIAFLINFAKCELTEDFRKFLDGHYGMGTATRFERADLGMIGSFGGRSSPDKPIKRQVKTFKFFFLKYLFF